MQYVLNCRMEGVQGIDEVNGAINIEHPYPAHITAHPLRLCIRNMMTPPTGLKGTLWTDSWRETRQIQ